MPKLIRILCAVLLVAGSACSVSVDRERTPDVRADSIAIAERGRAMSRAFVEGDTITLADLYTDDALLLPQQTDVRGNRVGARYFYAPPERRPANHYLTLERLDIHGDVAVDVGHWTQVDQPSRGGRTSTGRYLVIWERGDDGRWRMAYDMWHAPQRGGVITPLSPADSSLRAIATAASADRIAADLTALTGFGTRHTLSDTMSATRGIGAARRWVHAELSRISSACGGCIAVEYQTTIVPPSRRIPREAAIVNVLGIQRGSTDPNRYIIVSGHLDSRASDVMDATSDAPGAVDDASGVAVVLEAARLLSRHRFAASIVYVAFSGEEQGLLGSAALARRAQEEGWFVEALLNNDVVGNVQGIDGVTDSMSVRVFSEGVRATEDSAAAAARRSTGGEVDSPARQLARYVDAIAARVTPQFDAMPVWRLDRFGRGGDHIPFAQAGFPAVRFTETHEDYRRQHQDVRVEDGVEYGDVLEEAEPTYVARVAGLNAAVIASLAWAPAPPANVRVTGAVQPSTTLAWAPSPGADAYAVRWRETTAAQWQGTRTVRDATSHVFENVVIDNAFFGVAAVSADGFESPVVYAGPVGAWPARSDTPPARSSSLDVRFVTDEAEAVLAILDERAARRTPSEAHWQRLFGSEGYRRLQAREAAMNRAFTDSSFRAFVMSDTLLARREALRRTLAAWTAADPVAAARRAFRYLPDGSTIRARIYPSIKPRENSFVFEPRTDPAIFLFLDPSVSAAKTENTMAHELHHIGIAGACADTPADSALGTGMLSALDWMGGFAEGLAVLAASDGATADPHATSSSAERAVWQRDLAHAQRDIGRLESFFTDVMDGRLTGDAVNRAGFEFIATNDVPQGAFYTVGWLMGSTIERVLGRERLVASICSPHRLILDYADAARRPRSDDVTMPTWSPEFVRRLAALP